MSGCTRKKVVVLFISITSTALILGLEYFLWESEMTKPVAMSSRRSTFTEGKTSKLENTSAEFFLDKSTVVRWKGFGPERGKSV